MKNLIVRALTGIIFVIILIGAICLGPVSFVVLFSIITGATLWEFEGLVSNNEKSGVKRICHVIAGIYLFIATFLFAYNITGNEIFLPYLLFLIGSLIGELYYKAANPIANWSMKFFAQAYCAGSFALLNFIGATNLQSESINYTPLFILAIFIFVWLDDTGAYVVGSLIGKHRMFERVSPKKSWEGFFGGLVVALAGSQVFNYFTPEISWYNWLGLSTVVVIFGTWGDLIESLLKRTLTVKDSGHFLPGHGGLLDRFDSVILAIPAAYIYIQYFIQN